MIHALSTIPYFGAGMGFRPEIAEETKKHSNKIEAVEIITESYFDAEERLQELASMFKVIPHGVDLSIGSAEKPGEQFLKKIKRVCETIRAPYYSDHFAVTRLKDTKIGHLSPIWFTKESLNIVTDKINEVQNFLGIPLVLENITSYFDISEADFSEQEFIGEVCKKTNCGLLLDVANVHINSFNKRTDPYSFLKNFPLDHVIQIHLAGGHIRNGFYIDSHSEEIDGLNEGMWPLLEWLISRAPNLKALIIERDHNFKDDFETMVLKDLSRAKTIMKKPAGKTKEARVAV